MHEPLELISIKTIVSNELNLGLWINNFGIASDLKNKSNVNTDENLWKCEFKLTINGMMYRDWKIV